MPLAPSKVGPMKKLLASAFLATGLILNVEAQVSTVPPGISIAQPQGAPFVGQPPGAPFTLTQVLTLNLGGPPFGPPSRTISTPVSVPDAGSSALLLGLGFAALAAVRRQINQE
jgi:hypothetical protein